MPPRGWFYRLRVALLASILAAVSLWACHDVRERRARNEWVAPIRVGLVILRRGEVSPRAMAALRHRAQALEGRLLAELQRYRPGTRAPMIRIEPYGPVEVSEAPPSEPGDSWWDRAYHAFRLWRYTRAVDRAAQVPTHELQSRIYVLAQPPHGSLNFVEGFSEMRGRVGVARVDLDLETVDLALFVAAHELLHTLGATDKYDDSGKTLIPQGLPEPELWPSHPQRQAEIMARNRVLGPGSEVVPEDLSELAVGRYTAAEIGWTRD